MTPTPSPALAPAASPLRRRAELVDRLRALMHEHRALNTREAAHLLGVARGTATSLLRHLAAEGAIAKVEPNASPATHHYAVRGP